MKKNSFMKEKKFLILEVLMVMIACVSVMFKVYEKSLDDKKNNFNTNANMDVVLSLEDPIGDNSLWCGTFNLVWNDLKNDLAGQDIIFNTQSDILDNLNRGTFTTDYLSDDSYYKKYGKPTLELKEEIIKDIKEKFNETSDILDSFDFENHDEKDYFLYSMLKKDFLYPFVFDKLKDGNFKDIDKVKYFGIDSNTKGAVRRQVEVMYYNDEHDFALKIDTKGNDEIIVTMGNNERSFKEIYDEILRVSNLYEDDKNFGIKDTLKIPYMSFKTKKELKELENKEFSFADGTTYYISKALQTIEFEIDEKGGKIKSEAGISANVTSAKTDELEPRIFNVDDTFVLFLKEKDKNLPYFAMKVSDINNVMG